MMYVVGTLRKLARKKNLLLRTCFIDSWKAYDSVDHTLVRKVLAQYGVHVKMIFIIIRFCDAMRACGRAGVRAP